MYLEAAGRLEGRCSDWEQQMVPQETEDIRWFQYDPPVLHSQVESCLQHQLHLHIRSAIL